MNLKRLLFLLFWHLAIFSHSAETNWSQQSQEDLKAAHKFLESYHPASKDTLQIHPKFQVWLQEGYAQALKLSEQVSFFEGYRDCLAFYIAGFKDGHLYVNTPDERIVSWPGFLLSFGQGKFFIASSTIPTIPTRSEIIALDGRPPEHFMKSQVFPFVAEDAALESSWTKLAPFLLIDRGNPWSKKITTVSYKIQKEVFNVILRWQSIPWQDLVPHIQKATYGPPPKFSIHEFGKEGVWISIPTFQAQSQGAEDALNFTVQRLPYLQGKNPLVFDLRGNTGGAASWIVQILFSLYGEEYLGSLPHIKNSLSFAEDLLSPQKIKALETYVAQHPSDKKSQHYLKKANQAYENGEVFLKRSIDLNIFSKIKHTHPSIPNPVSGQVYLLTDGHCFSSALLFADVLLSIPGVIHIGKMTDGDTPFSQPLPFPLPSGKSTLYIPSMIRRAWERGYNEPYRPAYDYPGYMGDQAALENWVLHLTKT